MGKTSEPLEFESISQKPGNTWTHQERNFIKKQWFVEKKHLAAFVMIGQRRLGDEGDAVETLNAFYATQLDKLIENYDPNKSHFSSYLLCYFGYFCRDRYKTEKKKRSRTVSLNNWSDQDGEMVELEFIDNNVSGSPDEATMRQELKEIIEECLSQLSLKQREIVILRFIEKLSTKETAEKLGIPEGTVKGELSRALKRLSQNPKLREYFGKR